MTKLTQQLIDRGFDLTKSNRPRCSQCEALVINGLACHEHGCLNAVHECKGCFEVIPMRNIYCDRCLSY